MNDQTNTSGPELKSVTVSPIGGVRHSGPVGASTTIVTLIGGVDLDLTGATLPPGGARLTKVSVVGGVSVVVPRDVRVEVRGFSLIGGKNVERLSDTPADAPVLRINAWGIVGGVKVRVAA
jgi:hypothetical protein